MARAVSFRRTHFAITSFTAFSPKLYPLMTRYSVLIKPPSEVAPEFGVWLLGIVANLIERSDQ